MQHRTKNKKISFLSPWMKKSIFEPSTRVFVRFRSWDGVVYLFLLGNVKYLTERTDPDVKTMDSERKSSTLSRRWRHDTGVSDFRLAATLNPEWRRWRSSRLIWNERMKRCDSVLLNTQTDLCVHVSEIYVSLRKLQQRVSNIVTLELPTSLKRIESPSETLATQEIKKLYNAMEYTDRIVFREKLLKPLRIQFYVQQKL